MVRGRKTSLVIKLTPEERGILNSWQTSTTIQAGQARRGQIIILLDRGNSISDISREVGIRRRFVYKWVESFLQKGIAGLGDRPRRGSRSPANVVESTAGIKPVREKIQNPRLVEDQLVDYA